MKVKLVYGVFVIKRMARVRIRQGKRETHAGNELNAKPTFTNKNKHNNNNNALILIDKLIITT